MRNRELLDRLEAILAKSAVPYEDTLFIKRDYPLAQHRRELKALLAEGRHRNRKPKVCAAT